MTIKAIGSLLAMAVLVQGLQFVVSSNSFAATAIENTARKDRIIKDRKDKDFSTKDTGTKDAGTKDIKEAPAASSAR